MFDIVKELIDVHNVTNVLEGYPQFVFQKADIKGITMYYINFEQRIGGREFIYMKVFPNRVNVTVEYHDKFSIDYLSKKYLSRRSNVWVSSTTFDIFEPSKIEEFIRSDVEYIIELYVNDAGIV